MSSGLPPNPENPPRLPRWDRNRQDHPRTSRRSPAPRHSTITIPDALLEVDTETELPALTAEIPETAATVQTNRLVSTGFIAGLIFAFATLVLAAILIFVSQRAALTSLDAYLRSDAFVHAPPGSVQQAISVRLSVFRYALMAGGVLAGVAFGFLGLSLLLAGQPDETRGGRFRSRTAVPGLMAIALSGGLIAICIGFRPSTEIASIGGTEGTLVSAGAIVTPKPLPIPTPTPLPSATPTPVPTTTPHPSPSPTLHPTPTPTPKVTHYGWGHSYYSHNGRGYRRSSAQPHIRPSVAPAAAAHSESAAPAAGSAGNPDTGL